MTPTIRNGSAVTCLVLLGCSSESSTPTKVETEEPVPVSKLIPLPPKHSLDREPIDLATSRGRGPLASMELA